MLLLLLCIDQHNEFEKKHSEEMQIQEVFPKIK